MTTPWPAKICAWRISMAMDGWTLSLRAERPRTSKSISINILFLLLSSLVLLQLTGCGKHPSSAAPDRTGSGASGIRSQSNGGRLPTAANTATDKVPIYTYEIINTFPHDPDAFTQGLVFVDGFLLESTGLNGQSTLRKVDLNSGKVLKQIEVPAQYFAEGLVAMGGKLFQLTWRNQKGFVYDLETFQLEREFAYQGEGWGVTS